METRNFARGDTEHLAALYAQSDGVLGFRGDFEEDACGVFLGGFYDSAPFVYGEKAYGYAEHNEFMPLIADARFITVEVDGEPFSMDNRADSRLSLDFDTGVFTRAVCWRAKSGATAVLTFRRVIEMKETPSDVSRAVVTLAAEITGKAGVKVKSGIRTPRTVDGENRDPRKGESAESSVETTGMGFGGGVCFLSRRARNTGCAYRAENADEFVYGGAFERFERQNGGCVYNEYVFETANEAAFVLTKRISYTYGSTAGEYRGTLDGVAEGNRRILSLPSKKTSVKAADAVTQAAVRHAVYTLNTQAPLGGKTGVAAKGLTGGGYCGHYFWDTEIYLLPYYIYTDPPRAKSLLMYRYGVLGAARDRARELGYPGALFAWRTISGKECSAYYPAGTAQYHINADVALAFAKYCDITGDDDFMRDYGLEVFREVSAFYLKLGFFSENKGGAFVINGVTGPDEYNCLVNNNAFTNLAVRKTFVTYVRWADKLGVDVPDRQRVLRAAERMTVPRDKNGAITQDDGFEDREPWDFHRLPRDKFPLLMHYHYLDIYRRKVCKQADLILAMTLFEEDFANEDKERLYDYYNGVTTHDSSLSKAVFAIAAARLGRGDEAFNLFKDVCLADFENTHANTQDGLHMANLGGVWNTLVYGFAGLRDDGGRLDFNPRLPCGIDEINFSLYHRGCLKNVTIKRGARGCAITAENAETREER